MTSLVHVSNTVSPVILQERERQLTDLEVYLPSDTEGIVSSDLYTREIRGRPQLDPSDWRITFVETS